MTVVTREDREVFGLPTQCNGHVIRVLLSLRASPYLHYNRAPSQPPSGPTRDATARVCGTIHWVAPTRFHNPGEIPNRRGSASDESREGEESRRRTTTTTRCLEAHSNKTSTRLLLLALALPGQSLGTTQGDGGALFIVVYTAAPEVLAY